MRYAQTMTRDMDLIREILLEVEKVPAMQPWCSTPLLGHDKADVVAHIQLALDADFVEARIMKGMMPDAFIIRITNSGYDFLEASKQPTLWQQAKDRITSAGLPVTIAIAKAVLEKLINDALAKLH